MTPGTHELRRMAYLQAMGIDGYFSRRQLPGAAASRRLAVMDRSEPPAPRAPGADEEPRRGSKVAGRIAATLRETPGSAARLEAGSRRSGATAPADKAAPDPVPAFTVVAILAGDVLWLEELSYPAVATEQVQLVQSMALALGSPKGGAEVAQFKWPIHHNNQFDQGEESARAALTGFVGRKLEEHRCRALVLLGEVTAQRVSVAGTVETPRVTTVSTAQMLEHPGLKSQAWRDLRLLARQS